MQQPDKVRNAKVWLGVVTTNSRTVNSEPAVTSVPQAQSAVDIDEWLGSGPQLITTRDAWLAAYVDLSDPGQTQVWVFANWEVAMNMQPDTKDKLPGLEIRNALLNRLVAYIKADHIPYLNPSTPPESWQILQRTGKIISLPYRRSKVLFGTAHEQAVIALMKQGVLADGIAREDLSYLKYIFERSKDLKIVEDKIVILKSRADGREHNFELRSLSKDHLQVVMDRTIIPRTMETLASLENIGLFRHRFGGDEGAGDEMPVAWGFLGKDASVTSLHTEDNWRGQGVALILAEELIRKSANAFCNGKADDKHREIIYGHADVSEKNIGSRRVMEKLHGQIMWKVTWIEVDLDAAQTI